MSATNKQKRAPVFDPQCMERRPGPDRSVPVPMTIEEAHGHARKANSAWRLAKAEREKVAMALADAKAADKAAIAALEQAAEEADQRRDEADKLTRYISTPVDVIHDFARNEIREVRTDPGFEGVVFFRRTMEPHEMRQQRALPTDAFLAQVQHRVVTVLRKHPASTDTLLDMVRAGGLEASIDHVRSALDTLGVQGQVSRRQIKGTDGTVVEAWVLTLDDINDDKLLRQHVETAHEHRSPATRDAFIDDVMGYGGYKRAQVADAVDAFLSDLERIHEIREAVSTEMALVGGIAASTNPEVIAEFVLEDVKAKHIHDALEAEGADFVHCSETQ